MKSRITSWNINKYRGLGTAEGMEAEMKDMILKEVVPSKSLACSSGTGATSTHAPTAGS